MLPQARLRHVSTSSVPAGGTAWLAVGIPTVPRKGGADYLSKTIGDLPQQEVRSLRTDCPMAACDCRALHLILILSYVTVMSILSHFTHTLTRSSSEPCAWCTESLLDELPGDATDPLYGNIRVVVMNNGARGKHPAFTALQRRFQQPRTGAIRPFPMSAVRSGVAHRLGVPRAVGFV